MNKHITWHHTDLPQSDPYKRYLVIYAPWNYNNNQHDESRFDLACYYTGDGLYDDKPWHLTICHSVEVREILAWAEIGTPKGIMIDIFRGCELKQIILSRKDAEMFCDYYCKFPDECDGDQEELDEICEECPLWKKCKEGES